MIFYFIDFSVLKQFFGSSFKKLTFPHVKHCSLYVLSKTLRTNCKRFGQFLEVSDKTLPRYELIDVSLIVCQIINDINVNIFFKVTESVLLRFYNNMKLCNVTTVTFS